MTNIFDDISKTYDDVKPLFVPDGDWTAVINKVEEVDSNTGFYFNFTFYYPELGLTADTRYYVSAEEWSVRNLKDMVLALKLDIESAKDIPAAIRSTEGWTVKVRASTTTGKKGTKNEGKTYYNKKIIEVLDRSGAKANGAGAFG